MTTLQQEHMAIAKRLVMTRDRVFRHYLDAIIVAVISFIFVYLIAKGFIGKAGHYDSPYFLIFLIFPVLSFFLFIKQYSSLRLKEFNNGFSKAENYRLAKETLKTLGWQIRIDNKGFIEAYTNTGGWFSLTWTDQMISVVITDGKILFNSISNVDTYATQVITYGQNKRNMKKFAETFELLSVSRTAQQPTEHL